MALGIAAYALGAFGIEAAGAVASVLDTTIEKAFGKGVGQVLDEVQGRVSAYGGPPPNHELERALRLAELTSSLLLVRHWQREWRQEFSADREVAEPSFLKNASAWLHTQIGLCPSMKLEVDNALVSQMESALDALLRSGDPAMASRVKIAEVAQAVWETLVRAAGSDPPEYRARFLHIDAEPPGWAMVFLAFMREALKGKPRVRDAFAISRLAALAEDSAALRPVAQALAGDVAAMRNLLPRIAEDAAASRQNTEAILSGQDTQHSRLAELLAMARQGGGFTRAAEAGIPEVAVRRIVERLGAEGLGHEDLLPWLDAWIESAREQISRHVNEDAAFEAAVSEANRRFLAGRGETASAALMEEFSREERTERERQEERQRRQLRLLEEAIRFDELALDVEGAVTKLKLASRVRGAATNDEQGTWLLEQAMTFFERGDQKGQNTALLIAIAVYRAAATEFARDQVPLDWAMTQNNLGNALSVLGERESGTARLEEAVTAYRDALLERTRGRVPLQWATTQNNLNKVQAELNRRTPS